MYRILCILFFIFTKCQFKNRTVYSMQIIFIYIFKCTMSVSFLQKRQNSNKLALQNEANTIPGYEVPTMASVA